MGLRRVIRRDENHEAVSCYSWSFTKQYTVKYCNITDLNGTYVSFTLSYTMLKSYYAVSCSLLVIMKPFSVWLTRCTRNFSFKSHEKRPFRTRVNWGGDNSEKLLNGTGLLWTRTWWGSRQTSVVMIMNVKSCNKDCTDQLKNSTQGTALSNSMNIIHAVSQTYLPSISLVSSSSPEVWCLIHCRSLDLACRLLRITLRAWT